MSDMVFEIVRLVVTVLFTMCMTIVTVYAVRYLRGAANSYLSNLSPARQDALQKVFAMLVIAAEAMYREGHGAEKKAWVLTLAQNWANEHNIPLDMRLAEARVEAAVYEEINGPSGLKPKEIVVKKQIEDMGIDSKELPFVPGKAGDTVCEACEHQHEDEDTALLR